MVYLLTVLQRSNDKPTRFLYDLCDTKRVFLHRFNEQLFITITGFMSINCFKQHYANFRKKELAKCLDHYLKPQTLSKNNLLLSLSPALSIVSLAQ